MRALYYLSSGVILLTWFINGFVCKLMNAVPRHREIVARILGPTHAALFTTLIALGELCICVWILTGLQKKTCAWFQITIVMAMNVVEFIYVRDLLLFGSFNLLFAGFFSVLIYLNSFVWIRNQK